MVRFAPALVGLLLAGLAIAADLDALVQKLRSTNVDERREAARALAELGPDAKGATKSLTVALSDRDRFVRRFAAQALGAIGPSATGLAVDPLSKLLSAPGEAKEVQEAAAKALGVMGSKAIDPLVTALKNKRLDNSVRQTAAESLGNMREAAVPAVPALIGALDDPSVRAAAVGAIGQIGPPAKSAEKDLREILEDKGLRRDKALRASVQASLKKIGGKPAVPAKN
jgi:HEAT repeat protein